VNIKQAKKFIEKNWSKMTNTEIGKKLGISATAVRGRGKRMGLPPKPMGYFNPGIPKTTQETIDKAREELSKHKIVHEEKGAIKALIKENDNLKEELKASLNIKENLKPFYFDYTIEDKIGEAVVVVVASDWHIEELVKPETVNGLNKYNLDIAKQRVEQFFAHTLKLVKKEQHETKIETLVLALLGDFITGNIHEEFLETCQLRPIDASILAMNLIGGGIDYLLENSELKLVIPCAVGNHTRITKKVHIGTEQGNSLETFMYHTLKDKYKDNSRVTFMIAEGYLSYLTLWNFTICFQHGHAIRYGGGVGGLSIPVNKAIAQWEKLRHADLYVAGHWHQFFDGGNFIINGSMIGYNPFALFIKAQFERPRQAFFLVSKKYNCKTIVCPVLFNI